MTSSRAVGRCVRHRGHRATEDTEEFRDFASTTLPTTDGRIAVLRLRRVHQDRRAAFLSTPSETTERSTYEIVQRSRIAQRPADGPEPKTSHPLSLKRAA